MGQDNSKRISHAIEDKQNVFRGDDLSQIINDLAEEDSGLGFSEIVRTGAFVSKITVWDKPTNNPAPDPTAIKRTETIFNRTGVFVNSIFKSVYSEDGTSVIATITATVSRTGSNQVAFVEVVNVII